MSNLPVVLVGCGESQQSVPAPETKPKPTTAKAPDISIHEAAMQRNLEAVKQHIAAGADVNAKDVNGYTPLDWAIFNKDTETADLLRKHDGKTAEELKAEGK
jgi:ankyrin repeat protein